ncbi:uncharacterized protein LOC123308308 [Coccinella septempunctata]|uniref:uncharacterized protein LOC123308308 n=1 Tax=Coccinella septempunctata TaxID=41139 RepID=UPI001D06574A|nr:uncharacterized protein LOC123308308 [Coccinella septempunctata]
MYYYKSFLCFTVLFVVCYAGKKTTPLKNYEGPWTIRNASKNALPIIGRCPSMNIESSSKDQTGEGVLLFKTKIQTYTLRVVSVDQEMYQLYMPHNTESFLLGNVSLIHAEKSTFLVAELHTEDEMYYAVLTKKIKPSPDTDKKIEKTWKSLKPAKTVSLAPVEHENCTGEETGVGPNEPTVESTTELGGIEVNQPSKVPEGPTMGISINELPRTEDEQKSVSGGQEPSTVDKTSTQSTPAIIQPDLSGQPPQTLPIVGNDTKKMGKGTGSSVTSSLWLTVTSVLFYILLNNVFIK